jgi:hypothetical protein
MSQTNPEAVRCLSECDSLFYLCTQTYEKIEMWHVWSQVSNIPDSDLSIPALGLASAL